MIKTILWDLDATLLNFEKVEKYAMQKCFEQFGLGMCTDEMLARYSKINAEYWRRLERGEMTKPQILVGRFQEFFAAEGISMEDPEAFHKEYQVRLGDKVIIQDDGYELIKSLCGKVKQAIVTNGTIVAQERKLEKSGFNKLISKVFVSDEIGAEKPTKEFFDHVWKTLGDCKKEETMIVGDSLTSDMQGGNNEGIKCCWYNPKKQENHTNLRIDYEITNLQQIKEIIELENTKQCLGESE